MSLAGALSVIVKTSQTLVCSSIPGADGGSGEVGWCWAGQGDMCSYLFVDIYLSRMSPVHLYLTDCVVTLSTVRCLDLTCSVSCGVGGQQRVAAQPAHISPSR